jgi:hypothetical protein
MTAGTKVKVFGKKVATVVKLSSNGKRALVTGEYNGWTRLDNLKAVAA